MQMESFDYIVFGGTGDLALRKLYPAFYHRLREGEFPHDARVLAISRKPLAREEFLARVEAGLKRAAQDGFEAGSFRAFAERLFHVTLDAGVPGASWDALEELLRGRGDGIRVFYLATAPRLFQIIAENISAQGLAAPRARIVLEKPIGSSLASARAINDGVGAIFDESAIYRVDHYLGKETVQNLMALRFANSLFEPLWSAHAVDHIQITVSETVGVEGRGAYYDDVGALRDMVQNHLLQLLCLTAMEPPVDFDADCVRDEKLKVLRALRPITGDAVRAKTVRGQYRRGAAEGAAARGYAEEDDVPGDSRTETFCAIKAEIGNWRWAGVPFYLRTGKRLPVRASEIVVTFKPVMHSIFQPGAGRLEANRLVIRLQPDEGIKLDLMTKEPGLGSMRIKPATLNLSFADRFKSRTPDAYERLLMDVVRGNQTLFMRRDEVEAAWRWVEPILEAWERGDESPAGYASGSWGPSAAVALVERDGRSWSEELP
ncbi:MAG: glucose-6-phosphate dehydrogenase [Deltaproteobacteria bacterium]|nr:glucose-6-phosphate dehydrogenase [Deltaproteobacteria bacterium]